MINIIYSSSNQYFPYCLTSMYSLLENNSELTDVHFYVLSNNICDTNKERMRTVCYAHNASLTFIETEDIKKSIIASGAKLNFNISSFLRIFIPTLLPSLDKALFIDSDTLIQNGIKELYETDIENYACGMVYNQPIYKEFLTESKLDATDGYYNAGVILLNLKYWRHNNIQSKILDFYYSGGGNFGTDDQSVINAVVARLTLRLPYKYNAMVVIMYCSFKHMTKF